MILEFTSDNFLNYIEKSNKVVLVDFWASWCTPCKTMLPLLEELEKEYEKTILIGKIDVDNNQEISVQYGIRSIPTLLFFKKSKLIDKLIGVVSKETIIKKLDKFI